MLLHLIKASRLYSVLHGVAKMTLYILCLAITATHSTVDINSSLQALTKTFLLQQIQRMRDNNFLFFMGSISALTYYLLFITYINSYREIKQ